MKHIDVKFHYIQKKQVFNDIIIDYISTANQVADLFTKASPIDHFHRFCSLFSIVSLQLSSIDKWENCIFMPM
jgi:hypothetical protein